jgi:hypothetical protein
LIPIENQISTLALLYHVFVHNYGTALYGTNLEFRGVDGFPSAAREAILGRMDPVPGTLIFIVADVEFDRRCYPGIFSIDVIIRSDRFHHLRLVRKIFTVPQCDCSRKVTQRPMRLSDVRRGDAMGRKDTP